MEGDDEIALVTEVDRLLAELVRQDGLQLQLLVGPDGTRGPRNRQRQPGLGPFLVFVVGAQADMSGLRLLQVVREEQLTPGAYGRAAGLRPAPPVELRRRLQ